MNKDKEPKDKNGYPHGLWEVYHDDCNLHYKGSYIHGELIGYWEQYYRDGQLWYKGNFIYGNPHGLSEEYNINGELYSKRYYHIGEELYQTFKNKLIL